MTPAAALKIIDDVLSQFRGTRQDHETLAQAVEVLRDATKEKAPAAAKKVG